MAEVQNRFQEGKCNDQYAGTDDGDQDVEDEQRHLH